MEDIFVNQIVFYCLIIALFLALVSIVWLIRAIQRSKASALELDKAKNAAIISNRELEARVRELKNSQEELSKQSSLIQENKEKIRELVDYDQMTGYMNTHKFIDHIIDKMSVWKRLHIIYITIANINDVTNTLGFGVYESLLHVISESLRQKLDPQYYTFGIIKGDDFVIMTTKGQEDLNDDLDRVKGIFESPFYTDYFSFRLFAKIGIASYPEDDNLPEALIKKAGIAAISLLETPFTQYSYFSKVMQQKMFDEQKLFAEIDRAIKERQFIMYYQPKVANDGVTLMGYEALIRWLMPDGRIRGPGEFIDIAEKTGQIVYIGRQVIDMVCKDIKAYKMDKKGIHISLNLSSQHLENDDTISYLKRTANKYDIDTRSIEIEITETSLVKNYELTKSLLKSLRYDGFTIALDDFGTGYSSLSYIRNLPINKIKIDREFISRMPNVKYMKVLKAIMNLSKDLHYRVTVEGIETLEQWELLKPFEPNELQGFYFSKPLPIEEAIKYLM